MNASGPSGVEDSTVLLSGVSVVELGSGIALAHCGKLFVEAGASVLKYATDSDPVEMLGPFAETASGETRSLLSADLNLGKRIVGWEGLSDEALAQVISSADIVLVSRAVDLQKPAHIHELGGGDEGGSIVVAFSPFGQFGPKADEPGGDLLVQAYGGFLHMVGDRDRGPLRLGGYQAERSAGASGFTGAMVALFAREATGQGHFVDVSAAETVAYMEWKADIYEQSDGNPRSRGAPSQWFELQCPDGPFHLIYENPDWKRIIAVVGDSVADPRFETKDGRMAHHAEIAELLNDWAGGRSKSELYHIMQGGGIPVGMVADVSDVMTSPQYEQSGFLVEASGGEFGAHRRTGIAWEVDGRRPAISGKR